MEMQQTELLSPRSFPSPIARRRLSQGCEIIDFKGALSRRRGAVLPKVEKAQPEQGLRSIAPEDIERFLNQLRGEALLIGALSYDLGLRFSQLRFLRVRDINLAARAIELSDGRKSIPGALLEDLKEHIHEKLCGAEAGGSANKRDQLLFSASAFENVLVACSSFFARRAHMESAEGQADVVQADVVQAGEVQARDMGVRVKDNFLRVMGWFHTKRAARRGGRVQSPLGLFDKGPRIVRRDRGGVVHAYYVWRAV